MLHRKSTNKSDDAMISKANRDCGSRVLSVASVALSGALGVFSQCSALASDSFGSTPEPSAPKREWAASVRWENDTFGGTDKFYTDGISLAL